MQDPYKVLGLQRGASQEEIKAAYRELVKKYHPDKYQGNPLADLAEEKLREINEAYDQLTGATAQTYGSASGAYGSASRAYGSSARTGSAGGRNAYSYQSYGTTNPYYGEIVDALNRNDLARADQLLSASPNRDADWFFLSGLLAYKRGYLDEGLNKVRVAMNMDPANIQYKDIYRQMSGAGLFTGQGVQSGAAQSCMDCLTCYCCSSLISPCW